METEETFPMRINKYLSHRGDATRRGADELIEKGLVFVNGKPASTGMMIGKKDKVEIKLPKAKEYFYYAYYKPRGIITHGAQNGEKDVEESVRGRTRARVFPVGRLDKASRGLLILTNDGRITERLLSPEFNHDKEYHVQIDKPVSPRLLKKLREGVDIEGYVTKPAEAAELAERKISLVLSEGKKHQIRRMCAALGYTVLDIKRTRVLTVRLGTLKPGELREIRGAELKAFLETLKHAVKETPEAGQTGERTSHAR